MLGIIFSLDCKFGGWLKSFSKADWDCINFYQGKIRRQGPIGSLTVLKTLNIWKIDHWTLVLPISMLIINKSCGRNVWISMEQ